MTEREIFLEAIEMITPEARAAYLHGVCAQDVDLRGKVEELLREHFSNDSLLAGPAVNGERPGIAENAAGEGQMIGRYKLLEKIGEGGCGVVYVAEQTQPVRRRVAFKILKLGMDTKSVVARFEAERQALALMDHPNIAKVMDAGSTETGRPYFVMELVRGRKITEYCDEAKLSTAARLDLFLRVCQAIQHAHQKGIIHRDIKPSNILVTVNDGEPVPKVIDFGIAKATSGQQLTDKTIYTAFEQFIGTPAYMSPEQAVLTSLDVDTRSDIYAMGVLLYELLTGQTPFDANQLLAIGLDEMRRTIREQEPQSPSSRLSTLPGQELTTTAQCRGLDAPKLVSELRGDLDWIVMKCLEKDRTRRYETANGLAADIRRHLANEPVIARPPSTAYKLQKTWQRNKLVATAGAAIVAALILGVIGTTIGLLRAEKQRLGAELKQTEAEIERRRAEIEQQRAEKAEREAHQHLYTALLEQARATVLTAELGHRVRALDALRRAGVMSNSAALRGVAMSALALPDLSYVRELPLASDLTMIQLDPAFERMALCRGDGAVEIRAVSDHQLLATLPAATNLMSYVGHWSRDGRFLAVKRDHPPKAARADWEIWDVSRAKRILVLRDNLGGAFSFHPHLPRIMVGRAPATAAIWDLESGQEIARHQLAGDPIVVKFAPDGDSFAASIPRAGEWRIAVHRTADGAVRVSQGLINGVTELDWHPSGRWLGVPDQSGAVHLMDTETAEMRTLGRHKSNATMVEFSPDGRYLFSGGWDRELICWDARAMRRAFTIALDSYHLQLSSNGRQCAIQRQDGEARVQLYTFERPAHLELAEDLGGPRGFAAFSADGRWLAASGDERWVVWDLHGDGQGASMNGVEETRLSFAANCELFVNPRGGGSRWRVTAGTNEAAPVELARLDLPKPTGLFSLCLVSNGVVFTGTNGSRIATFDQIYRHDARWSRSISGLNGVSHDERWLAMFRPFSPELHVYRLSDFAPVTALTNRDRIRQFVFSPLGDEVAVACRKGVEFWSATTWQRTRHLTNFNGILYSPDARTLWLSTDYRASGLYDARTVEPLLPLPPNTIPLAVSPDGRYLAARVNSRHMQVWDLEEARRQLAGVGLDWRD